MPEYETYSDFPLGCLLDMADNFRAAVAVLNGAKGSDYERISLPPNAQCLVSADKTGVRYNFRSKAIVKHILGDIEDMLTVADEARLKLASVSRPGMHAYMLAEMEREANKSLDIHFGQSGEGAANILSLIRR